MIIILVVLVLWLWKWTLPTAHAEPQKTEKQIYSEKWQAIGELKYEEREMTRKAQEAKAKKDALLEDLNSTNEGEQ
jgi:hypothetical protein